MNHITQDNYHFWTYRIALAKVSLNKFFKIETLNRGERSVYALSKLISKIIIFIVIIYLQELIFFPYYSHINININKH